MATRCPPAKTRDLRPDERILQLLLLLLDAARPVSRAEIFAAIDAYRTKNPAAGERKFERDKKELRALGVPIEEPDDAPNSYRVDRRAYELPPLPLEDDERAALALAAEALRAWNGLPYRELVEDALRKLSYDAGVLGRDPLPRHLAVALPPRRGDARLRRSVAALTAAVEARKRVRLTYAAADGDATERTVDPYALLYTGGDWQLVGHCHLRGALRTFRVDRLRALKVAGRPGTPDFERPPGWTVASHVQRSPWVFRAGHSRALDVVLDVGPERAWVADEDFGPDAVREPLPDDGWTRVRFRSRNPDYIVTRVLDAAGHVRVVAPADLRARVVAAADAVAALYEEPA
jgi:proteasome accessory factor B